MRPARETPAGEPVLISNIAPGSKQIWLAAIMPAVSLGLLAIIAPYASRPTANTAILLPAYGAAVLVIELITAALLLALFYVQRSRAILILSAGYLFSGALVGPWIVSFPGLFAGLGIDADIQATAAFAALRRLGFPIFVVAYALAGDRQVQSGSVAAATGAMVAAVLAFVALATWLILSNRSYLPEFMIDSRTPGALWHYIPAISVGMYLVCLSALAARRRTILDLWLIVVVCTLLVEIIQISYLGSAIRMSVGWWAGRLYGLVSASIVLVVLLTETMAVYSRLARSIASERQVRQNRLTALEALSASIAHEVNQPLASMVTNADAGLRWLEKSQPDFDEARAAMRRIVEEGHRANMVVSGIRNMFIKGARERSQLDVNALIERMIQKSGVEARLGRVTVRLALDCSLPPVIGNAAQLQHVISNLIDNAIEAMRAVPARQRVLSIATRSAEIGEVVVSVSDTGPGIDASMVDRIFEPFFTTKADGMGMGLMFCRATIEAHGGRLRVSPASAGGAVFSFSLPVAMGEVDLSGVGT